MQRHYRPIPRRSYLQHESWIELDLFVRISAPIHHEADGAVFAFTNPGLVVVTVAADPSVDVEAPDLGPKSTGETCAEGAFAVISDFAGGVDQLAYLDVVGHDDGRTVVRLAQSVPDRRFVPRMLVKHRVHTELALRRDADPPVVHQGIPYNAPCGDF